jgi:Arc/MetJ-type ribon-helix-helix transcriptional regulator
MYVMKRTTVHFEERQLKTIKQIATERRTSFSDVLREIIDDVAEQRDARVTLRSLDERLKVVESAIEQMTGD